MNEAAALDDEGEDLLGVVDCARDLAHQDDELVVKCLMALLGLGPGPWRGVPGGGGEGLDVDEGDGLLGVGADEGNVGAVLGGDVLHGDVVGHEDTLQGRLGGSCR